MSLLTLKHHWNALEKKLLAIQNPEQVEVMKRVYYAGAAGYEIALQSVLKIQDRDIGKVALDSLESEIDEFFEIPPKQVPLRIILP